MGLEGDSVSDIHLTPDLLLALSRGEVEPYLASQIAGEHLLRVCQVCHEEILAFRRKWRRGQAEDQGTVVLIPSLAQKLGPEKEQDERRAWRDLLALQSLDPEERIPMIRRARSRYRGTELFRLLLQESDRLIPSDLEEARRLAELAREVLDTDPGHAAYQPLLVLGMGALANIARVRGDFSEADTAFERVREVMRNEGVIEADVTARIDELEGSLRKDQRRFQEAEDLLARAELFYQIADEWEGSIRVLVSLGSVFLLQGKFQQAIPVTRNALRMMSPNSNPRLHLCTRFNLAYCLVKVGQSDEAARMLDEDEERNQRFSEPATRTRIKWLRGDIARIREDDGAAERAYREAFESFLNQGLGYDAALAGLDLALLCLRQGRTADVKELAEQMLPVFEAPDVHREALAELALFQEAARREEVAVEPLLRLVTCLQEARDVL
jgi:tetratricopeptide (TPR) repeat protein